MKQTDIDRLTGTSLNDEWNSTLKRLPQIARTDHPVLILGPSGSGKERLTQSLHQFSLRSDHPFVSVNCSALSESLIESELFGHTKGAFTGATNDRKGAFESARGGTLFLDEIGDLPIHLQPKLLRALENQEIRPLGSDRTIKADVRIIAATHQNLETLVRQGKFRADLFYRLNVILLRVPSLAERIEDFENFLFAFAKEQRVCFSYQAIQMLKHHTWPGNIRELKNAVARAAALFGGDTVSSENIGCIVDHILIRDLETAPLKPAERPKERSLEKLATPKEEIVDSKRSFLKDIERQMILQTLLNLKGNQRLASQQLGIPKSTLNDRLKGYNVKIEELLAKPDDYVCRTIPLEGFSI